MKIKINQPKLKIDIQTEKLKPTLENLEVDPNTTVQEFTHPNSDGYDKVTVKAIEATELNITPTTQSQEYSGLYNFVSVGSVDNTIDNNILSTNIKSGVTILGVEGNVVELNGEEKTTTPTEQTQIITPSVGKNGITQMTVNPIPSEYIIPTGTVNITENGTVNIKNYEMANVNIGGGPVDPNITAYRTQTTTEMNNLTTMQENDLCVVYSDTHGELSIPTVANTVFYFPKNITLPEAIVETDSTTTGTSIGNYTIEITPTSFTVKYRVFVATTQMEYSSTDGKNYTRITTTNTLNISKSITEDKSWLHYFMFPNRQTLYTGTYNYTNNNTWDMVAVPNLTAGNVKENVTILGVTGSYTGPGQEKDVNFYDYLGNLVYSYTAQEFQALSELPAGPTHDNMTFQEWNWQLSEAKTYVTNHGMLDIGETCATSDGKTRIYIDLPEGALKPALGFAVNGSVTVNWGDNTTETITGTSTSDLIRTEHAYSTKGQYVITLESDSTIYFVGLGTGSSGLLTDISSSSSSTYNTNLPQRGFLTTIKKIELGSNVYFSRACFFGLSLESINIPQGIAYFAVDAFGKTNLKYLTVCRGIAVLPTNIFQSSLLERITIPNTITSCGDYCFNGTPIKKLILPDSMTAISNYMLQNCVELQTLIFSKNITNFNKTNILSNNPKLKQLTLPTSLTNLGGSCMALTFVNEINIPSSVTTIASNALAYSYGLSKIKFLGNFTGTIQGFALSPFLRILDFTNNSSIPTLSGSTALNDLPSDFKIIVRDNRYTTWTTTGNWASYSSHIVKQSDYSG